jgi:hypothetical protein
VDCNVEGSPLHLSRCIRYKTAFVQSSKISFVYDKTIQQDFYVLEALSVMFIYISKLRCFKSGRE